VRIELFGDSLTRCASSTRARSARLRQFSAPALAPDEWAVPCQRKRIHASAWETPSFFGQRGTRPSTLLSGESSLRPMVFLDEPQILREAATKHLAAALKIRASRPRQLTAASITFGPKRNSLPHWKIVANSHGTTRPRNRFHSAVRAFLRPALVSTRLVAA